GGARPPRSRLHGRHGRAGHGRSRHGARRANRRPGLLVRGQASRTYRARRALSRGRPPRAMLAGAVSDSTRTTTPRGDPTAPEIDRVSTEPVRRAPVAPASLSVGQMLGGRYRVLRFLGAGGMGAVYRARDQSLDVEVALKVVRPDVVDLLRDEVRLAQRVTHPNVCRTYDLEEADGISFVKMEVVEGRTLASRLRQGALP